MKELILRTLTGISLIILVAGSILLGPYPFLGMMLVVFGLGAKELFSVYGPGRRPARLVMTFSSVMIFPIAFAIMQFHWNPLWLIASIAGWMVGFLWSGLRVSGILILFWLTLPLTSFYALGWNGETGNYHSLVPLAVITLIWINDTFAYVMGSLFGKHKMTPKLSPGKTWEGFFGGILFTLLGGWIIFRISGEFTITIWMLFALISGILGLLGDLFESRLKRKKNVKNMGNLLPGHGGILDRFDSLLFVAPAQLILLILIRLIQ